MVKKTLAFCLILAVLFGISAVSAAAIDSVVPTTEEAVKFYDASQNLRIGAFENSESIYAKVKFPLQAAFPLKLITAKYDGEGVLLSATPTLLTEKQESYTTESISTAGLKTVKLFVWEASSLRPATLPGIIEKTGVSETKLTKKEITLEANKSYLLSALFEEIEGLKNGVDTESFKLEVIEGNATYTPNSENWANGEIVVNEEGTIKVKAYDNVLCTATEAEFTAVAPVVKFTANNAAPLEINSSYAIGTLFEEANVNDATVEITVENAEFNPSAENWRNGTINTRDAGIVKITITDNDFCIPTVAEFTVKAPVDKFTANEATVKLSYPSMEGSITLGEVFEAIEGAVIGNVAVTVNGEAIEAAEPWTATSIVVGSDGATITITDNDFCNIAEATVTVTNPDPVDKFVAKDYSAKLAYPEMKITATLGDIFAAVDEELVDGASVTATLNGETIEVAEDWAATEVVFTKAGEYAFTIKDDVYCNEATAKAVIEDADAVDKFEAKENVSVKLTYPSMKAEATLGDVFTAVNEEYINSANVTVTGCEAVADTADWKNTTLTFNAAGAVEVTITDGNYCKEAKAIVTVTSPDPVDKFTAKADLAFTHTVEGGTIEKTLGDIFAAKEGATIDSAKVTVTVNDEAVCAYVKNETDWTQSTLSFKGTGEVTITITDTVFCNAATAAVKITEPEETEKFSVKFPNTEKYTYRVGNSGTVSVGTLFSVGGGATAGTIKVTVENVSGTASGTYAANASDWTKGTIQFEGTGVVKVTIDDNMYSKACELTLEVVDAVNATSATNAKSNNVVLLNDAGFSSLEVTNGYTLYGNGFTLTCGSDSAALDMGYSFVTLNNGTLDNVQIVCPNYDYAVLYKSNLTSSENRSETTDKTRYYNAKSGVMASGNSRILNSRISGGRASLNVSGGNIVVDNSRIELGAVASVLVGSANSLVLNDTTLVQKPTASTYDPNKVLMGFSVLYMCDSNGNATPTTISGSFVQQAWIDESDSQYVPSAGKDIVTAVLKEKDYIHDIDGDGTNESLNLGFAYMPEDPTKTVAEPANITDNRTDKIAIPYEMKDVKITISIVSTTVYVYSYKNTNGTTDSFKIENEYVPDTQSDIITVNYSDTADGLEQSKSYGTSGWIYELNVDLDKLSGYALDFSKVSMNVNGVNVTDFRVNDSDKPSSPIAVTAGGTEYILTATIDGKEYEVTFKVTGTETSKESPSVVATNYAEGLCVASSYGGTWHGAAPALEGIQVKYWSVAEKQYKTINLSDYTPTTSGKQNGTNTTWTYTPTNNDFTLTLTGGQVHSSNNVYAMPVVCDGKLYFVAASSNGLVNSGNSARTITVSYSFKDNNNGAELKFSHTWSVEENKDAQYKYSDFCNGTLTKLTSSSGGGFNPCVTPDTLVTLADGSQKRIDEVTYADQLLVWNFFDGKYDVATPAVIFNHGTKDNTVIELGFDDESVIKVVWSHQFFDVDANKFITITDENVKDYVGHKFIKMDGEEKKLVKLVDYDVRQEKVGSYGIITALHYNAITGGFLTTNFEPVDFGLYNYFEVGENMTFDKEKMEEDIEKYGLYTYADFADYLTPEFFDGYNIKYMKVSVGKGQYTYEGMIDLIKKWLVESDEVVPMNK